MKTPKLKDPITKLVKRNAEITVMNETTSMVQVEFLEKETKKRYQQGY